MGPVAPHGFPRHGLEHAGFAPELGVSGDREIRVIVICEERRTLFERLARHTPDPVAAPAKLHVGHPQIGVADPALHDEHTAGHGVLHGEESVEPAPADDDTERHEKPYREPSAPRGSHGDSAAEQAEKKRCNGIGGRRFRHARRAKFLS